VPEVLVSMVCGSQPCWSLIELSGSVTSKLTIGLPTYQPCWPSGDDGATDEAITGGVRSTSPPATMEPAVMERKGEQFMHS